jgi:hypothetical protein
MIKALTKCPHCAGYTSIGKNNSGGNKRKCDYCGQLFESTNIDTGEKLPAAAVQVLWIENNKIKIEVRMRHSGFHEFDKNTFIYGYKEW